MFILTVSFNDSFADMVLVSTIIFIQLQNASLITASYIKDDSLHDSSDLKASRDLKTEESVSYRHVSCLSGLSDL